MQGPERLFYDKSSYTGTAKNGGPTTRRRDSGCVDANDYFNRSSTADKRGVKLQENDKKPTSSRERFEQKLKQMQSSTKSWATTGTADVLKPTPSLSSTSSLPQIRTLRRAATCKEKTRKGRSGPERFFYDKSSWTGTAKNGGPTTIDANLSEPSYHLDRSASDVRGVRIEQKTKRGRKTAQERLEEIRQGWKSWSVTGLAKDLLKPLPMAQPSRPKEGANTVSTTSSKAHFNWSLTKQTFSKSVGAFPSLPLHDECDGQDDSHLIAQPPSDLSIDNRVQSPKKLSMDDSMCSGNSTARGSEDFGIFVHVPSQYQPAAVKPESSKGETSDSTAHPLILRRALSVKSLSLRPATTETFNNNSQTL